MRTLTLLALTLASCGAEDTPVEPLRNAPPRVVCEDYPYYEIMDTDVGVSLFVDPGIPGPDSDWFVDFMLSEAIAAAGVPETDLIVNLIHEDNWYNWTTPCHGEGDPEDDMPTKLNGCTTTSPYGAVINIVYREGYTNFCDMSNTLVHEMMHAKLGVPAGHDDPVVWGDPDDHVSYRPGHNSGVVFEKGKELFSACENTLRWVCR